MSQRPAKAWPMLLALAACGPKYNLRVPDELVAKLPYEARIDLLESENDLAVAIDHVDEAENEVQRTRAAIRRAKSRRSDASDEVGQARDDGTRAVAELTVQEAEAQVEYLRARQELNLDNVDLQQLALRCAAAKYQLARLTAARKSKVEGSERLDPKDFEDQVKRCEAEVAERKADMRSDNERFQAAKGAWEKQRQALAQKTFDARASPYVE